LAEWVKRGRCEETRKEIIIDHNNYVLGGTIYQKMVAKQRKIGTGNRLLKKEKGNGGKQSKGGGEKERVLRAARSKPTFRASDQGKVYVKKQLTFLFPGVKSERRKK